MVQLSFRNFKHFLLGTTASQAVASTGAGYWPSPTATNNITVTGRARHDRPND